MAFASSSKLPSTSSSSTSPPPSNPFETMSAVNAGRRSSDITALNRDGSTHSDKMESSSQKGGLDGQPTPDDQSSDHHVEETQGGVSRIEAMNRVWNKRSIPFLSMCIFLALLCAALSLESGTIYSYQAIVSALYKDHSGLLASITIATSIINAVSQPFIAKICDISSRHLAYLVVLVFFVIGFIITAAGTTPASYAVGSVIGEVGEAGLNLVTDVLVADLTNLQWRGFVTALVSSPYIVFAWVAANVSGQILDHGSWRWGYGMFCIMLPGITVPLIVLLWAASRKAKKVGSMSVATSSYQARVAAGKAESQSYFSLLWAFFKEADLFGLIILAFGWCLLLLPFSLKSTASGGWNNPSLIAMLVVGCVLLLAFIPYEAFLSPKPLITKRIAKNKAFWLSVIIDLFYFASGNLRSLYFSSYVYVIKDWTTTEWGYFNQISTVGLCVFGLMNGLILRYTHRYKFLQLSGLAIRILAMGVTYWARGDNATTGALVATQILNALGGSCSVVGTRVATQASVPHQDLAMIIALLALFTKVGGAIGSAIAVSIWSDRLPSYLVDEGFTTTQAATIFKSFTTASRKYTIDSPERQAIIRASSNALEPIFLAVLILSIVPFIAGIWMPNWRLDKRHNKVERVDVAGRFVEGGDADDEEYTQDRRIEQRNEVTEGGQQPKGIKAKVKSMFASVNM